MNINHITVISQNHLKTYNQFKESIHKLLNSNLDSAKIVINQAQKYCIKYNLTCENTSFTIDLAKVYIHESEYNLAYKTIGGLSSQTKNCKEKDIIMADYYQILTWIYEDKGDLVKADSFSLLAYNYAQLTDNVRKCAYMGANRSSILMSQGKYNLGIQLILDIINKYDIKKDSSFAIGVYSNLCAMLKGIKNYKSAIEYGEKGLTFSQSPNNYNYPVILNNLGSVHIELGELNKALELFSESQKISIKNNYKSSLSFAIFGIAKIYQQKNDWVTAENKLLELEKFEKSNNFLSNLVTTYLELANIKMELKMYDLADHYLNKANEIILRNNLPKEKIIYSETKAINTLLKQNPEIGKDLKDALKRKKIEVENYQNALNAEFLEIYKSNSLKDEKEKLEIENKLKNIHLEKQNIWLSMISFLALLFLFFAIIIWRFFKREKNLNLKISAQKTQIQLLNRELNHRVKNNLTFMTSLLEMQSRRSDSIETKSALKESESRLKALALVHSQLFKSDSDTEVNLNQYLKDVTNHLHDIFSTNDKPIVFETQYIDFQINAEDAMRLGLIVNELVTNSVKHAFINVKVPQISIITTLQDGKLALKYEDNGPGISHHVVTDEHQSSLGIKLIDLLRKQLGDRYVVMV